MTYLAFFGIATEVIGPAAAPPDAAVPPELAVWAADPAALSLAGALEAPLLAALEPVALEPAALEPVAPEPAALEPVAPAAGAVSAMLVAGGALVEDPLFPEFVLQADSINAAAAPIAPTIASLLLCITTPLM